jgi:vacuolar-type H+-ATPase subunit H
MILAYLLLLTGLTISAVAIYYSVVGLTAIFSAAAIPIIIMGSALEVGKLVCASWLKANWERAPRFMKYYMILAVMVLMLITSMGIFGFLSKAHNDQNLVSGDVQSKIAIYDEKIKTSRDNIDANRKALKQMDEAVDQVMGRSSDEKGAEKAVQIRRSQQKERARLQSEIASEQKTIAAVSEERAPIAAEVRKVEAEVGPIKYIAKFIYGEHGADENMLEKAVTWIIVLIVVVFDPLAVIMLLAAQMTFGWKREDSEPIKAVSINDFVPQPTEHIPNEEISEPEIKYTVLDDHHEPDYPDVTWPFPTADRTTNINQTEAPSETPVTALGGDITGQESSDQEIPQPIEQWNAMIAEAEAEANKEIVEKEARKYQILPELVEHTNERNKPDLTEVIESDESKKKTYMMKAPDGTVQIKNR